MAGRSFNGLCQSLHPAPCYIFEFRRFEHIAAQRHEVLSFKRRVDLNYHAKRDADAVGVPYSIREVKRNSESCPKFLCPEFLYLPFATYGVGHGNFDKDGVCAFLKASTDRSQAFSGVI